MVATASFATPMRKFVPQSLDAGDWSQVEPLADELLRRPIETPEQLENWLLDFSELSSVIDEFGTRRHIDMTCHSDDPDVERRYMEFIEKIEPQLKSLSDKLRRKYLVSPARAALEAKDRRYALLSRSWQADVDVFRDQNVTLETEVTKIATEYGKTCGAMTVNFGDKELTLQQLSKFEEETDRATREQVWRLGAARRLQDRHKIEDLFDRILPLRHQIALNAGLKDFRQYTWKVYKRFDYTVDDCLRFGDSIAECCMPVVNELHRQRASALKLDKLRPWDSNVDPKGRPPLRPFDANDVDSFVTRTRDIFAKMSPALGEQFESLRTNKNLDLDSRRGKQPGGYQSTLNEARQPFIFMNAAGLHNDVVVLLHEGGHAFHALASREEPLLFLRDAPIEFCEVASMSMELLGNEHMDAFYPSAEDRARARRTQLERVVYLLPWVATIDSFQHWLYTHPGHSHDERKQEWLRLRDIYGAHVDWSGLDDERAHFWQRQVHLFSHPFYYVEYGIAQLGALQLWQKAAQDPRQALANYRSALRLGGTRPLPELFAAAGIRFDFSKKTLAPLMRAVQDELEQLPA